MHNPRGSNDRNCETNVNRNNGNRLFDSQNNAKGGYACPRAVSGNAQTADYIQTPTMFYYIGSLLTVEWTQQHSCGIHNALCEIVLQYMCESDVEKANGGLRDGEPETKDDSATDRIPLDEDQSKLPRYGMHETYQYYKDCQTRLRNTRLFVADRQIENKGRLKSNSPAIQTRQNPNGNRNGFECPEERDYYPYWHPTPWRDIAVITNDKSRCEYYKAESQNVKARGQCLNTERTKGYKFNTKKTCEDGGGVWDIVPAFGIAPPECMEASMIATRDNHLGSTHNGEMSRYNWTLPDVSSLIPEGEENIKCVLRLRYNMSSSDYSPWKTDDEVNRNLSPLMQDEPMYGKEGEEKDFGYGFRLDNAINTNQVGRTFQDRSYVFLIQKRPEAKDGYDPNEKIFNLNVRGKRGNIVQTFPSVEYDFVPNILTVEGGSYVHIQWTGSDYNPNRQPNDAEGGPPYKGTSQTRADRSNLVQADFNGRNVGKKMEDVTMFVDPNTGKPDTKLIQKLALLDQPITDSEKCKTYDELRAEGKSQNEAERDERNCGKLNAAKTPYFNAGLVRMTASGAHRYYSSRNNNFSNRSQKGLIVVQNGWYAASTTTRVTISALVMATFLAFILPIMY
eukprot:CAMPEP_0117418388 /NCGR_PEP_ID=MMETSP0758-20121206/184_1 /TAXON_ID=63605 /ORGANISM="Percolomonas cosmopolitus, Strain AE-1 (ATCC 50343)" /LENGTH=620 /DNA_ID=CAMNT_0005198871 /DNA_START=115 /DNA_END=1977 /DNA_ORIENTATION=+